MKLFYVRLSFYENLELKVFMVTIICDLLSILYFEYSQEDINNYLINDNYISDDEESKINERFNF